MGLKVTNNAFGTLNAGINSSATTIVLAAGQGARFPSLSAGDYFYATLIDTSNNLEIVKVTARSTDTMTVVRGQDNTTARAYSTNDRFELRPTAALFNEKADIADVVLKSGSTMTGNLTAPRITTPNQPAFSAIGTGTQSWSGSTATQVLNITINTGGLSSARNSHFNTSTKRFTAPVAGVYAFYHGYTITGAATGPESYLRINGSSTYRIGVIGYLYSGGYFTANSFEIMYLNANDYVDVWVQNNNNASFTIDLGRSYFGGYLIG